MNLFSYNGKLFHLLTKIADCMILSLLWIVCSIPVVTSGSASAALYYCVVKVIREDDGTVLRSFWHGFKDNLKQGTIVTLLIGVAAVLVTVIGSGVYGFSQQQDTLSGIYFVYLILLIFCIAWLHYIFSYIARFQAPLTTILKNSLAICLTNIPQSFSMAILFIIMVVVFLYFAPHSLIFLLLVPAVYALVSSYLLERIYLKYMPEEDEESTEEEA